MPAINFAAAFRFIGIRGAIAIGLGLALVFTMWRADSLSEQRDEALREVGAIETRLEVSNASLDALQAELATFVEEGALRGERAAEALETAEEAGQAMREAAREEGRTDWRGQEGL